MKQKSRYAEPKRVKSGRNLFVVDFDNRSPLAGLSWDAGNGQYFYTFWKSEKDVQTGKKTRKDFSFGVDYQEAVFRFKNWKQDTQKFSLSIPDDATLKQQATIPSENLKRRSLGGNTFIINKDIPKDITLDLDEIPFTKDQFPEYVKINSILGTDKKYALHKRLLIHGVFTSSYFLSL